MPDDLVRLDAHGDPLLRRLGRGAARPFRAADDVQALAEHGRWLGHPVTTGRRIAVTGVRGGSGKSTVAALMASVFARHRQDRVLALDLDPLLGSLPLRLGVPPGPALADLAHEGLGTAPFDAVQPHLFRLTERLWALPGTRGVGDARLDAALYRAAGLPLSRFFGVTVADCGPGVQTRLHREVLAAAHAQVLVTPATAEGAANAGRALDWLGSGDLRGLVARTLVVFTVRSPLGGRPPPIVRRAREILREVGADAVALNYDRHLAVGTTVNPSRLAYTTRVTAIAIAAEALRRAL